MDFSKLDSIKQNAQDTAQMQERLHAQNLAKRKQWFVDNNDKLVDIQRAFKAMTDKLGSLPDEFRDGSVIGGKGLDVIKLCGNNHIGVQVYWHYRYIVFPLLEADGTKISIDDNGEPLNNHDIIDLYDKLKFAVENFPARFDKVIDDLLAKSEKAKTQVQVRLNNIEH